MDVWVKAEPEAHHMIGLSLSNGNMQYGPYENFTTQQYPHQMPPNASPLEPPPVYQYPPSNGYDHHHHPHHHQHISPHSHPQHHHPHSQQQYYHHQHQPSVPDEMFHHLNNSPSSFEQQQQQQNNTNYEELVDPNQKYEYHEPDENFISIDDDKVRSFLVDLVQKETKKKKDEEQLEAQRKLEIKPEAEEATKLNHHQQKQKQSSKTNGDILNESDESTIQEVDYDDKGDMVLLDSDVDYVDENEEGIELNWIDLEQKAQKQSIECFLCGKSVASSYNLRRHMMIHTGERPFGCDMCYKRFREFSDLKKHRRIHSTQMNFKCMVCRVNDPSLYDPTKCVACDKSASGDVAGVPDMADLLLDSVPNLVSPSSNAGSGGKKEFQCPMCSRIFGTRHNLKRHFMIHTGEKPFSCTICQKPFREVSTLKKHMHTHTRVKVYKCSLCRQKFTDYDSFLEHKDTHPKKNSPGKRMRGLKGHEMQIKRRRSDTESAIADEEDDEEFECPECGEKSASIELYADHIKQHESSVEFQCYICKQMFESRDLLVAHFSIHDVDDESSADA